MRTLAEAVADACVRADRKQRANSRLRRRPQRMAPKKRHWVAVTGGHSSKAHWKERVKVLDGFHTPPIAVEELLRVERFSGRSWECANGFARITNVLRRHNHFVLTSDIHRWHPTTMAVRDFLSFDEPPRTFRGRRFDIITNPPFVKATAFAEKAMELLPRGGKLAMILRTQFVESKKRKILFDKYPPARIWVFSYRLPQMHRFLYKGKKGKGGSALSFSWFIWIKGHKGPTILKWI